METTTLPIETQTVLRLVEACMRNEREAQKELYQSYKSSLFRVCLRYASGVEEAEDFLQEGFIRIFRNLHNWQPTGSLGGWMKTIMVNTALEHNRKLSAKASKIPLTHAENLQQDESVISRISGNELMKLVQELPAGFRTVFNLYAIEGYSHAEIGEMLNISEGTSKSQYSRARAILRDKCEQLTGGVVS